MRLVFVYLLVGEVGEFGGVATTLVRWGVADHSNCHPSGRQIQGEEKREEEMGENSDRLVYRR